jgi:hypothetical protein
MGFFFIKTLVFCFQDVAIGRLSVTEQEAIIVEDLLLCMLVSIDLNKYPRNRNILIEKGIEGKFIKTPSLTDKQAQRSFHIDRSLGQINQIFN